MWLGIAGGILMAFLLFVGIKGAVITGMAFVTIISWIPGHSASYLGASSPIPGGESRMELFKHIVKAPTLSMTGLAWDWSAFTSGGCRCPALRCCRLLRRWKHLRCA